jgi:hypothetical protein
LRLTRVVKPDLFFDVFLEKKLWKINRKKWKTILREQTLGIIAEFCYFLRTGAGIKDSEPWCKDCAYVEFTIVLIFYRISAFLARLPDFSWYNIPKQSLIYQMTGKCTKCP